MKRVFFLSLIMLLFSESRCGVFDLAFPIVDEEPNIIIVPTQEDIRNRIVQTFAVYIDQNLLRHYKRGLERKHYVYEIAEAAADIEIDEPRMGCLTLAIAKKESDFRIRGNSKSTAKGLCQVIPRYHRQTLASYNISEKDLLESPGKSLHAGYAVIKSYFGRTKGDCKKAIFLYRGINSKAKGMSLKRCEEYWHDVEDNYITLVMRVYG